MAGLSDLVSSVYQKGKSTYDSAKNWAIDASNKVYVANAKSNLKKYIKGECPAGFIILNSDSTTGKNKTYKYTYDLDISSELESNSFRLLVNTTLNIKVNLGTYKLNAKDLVIKSTILDNIFNWYENKLHNMFSPDYREMKISERMSYYKRDASLNILDIRNKLQQDVNVDNNATIDIKISGITKVSASIYQLKFFIDRCETPNGYISYVDMSTHSIEIPVTDVAEEYMQELENRTKAVKELEDATIKAGADPSKVMTLDYSSEEALDKSVGSIVPGIPVQKPTDETKKEVLATPADPYRKAPEKITVTGSNKASVMQSKLSQENLEQGSNKQDTNYFDKRPGNAKLGDVYGMQTKLDAPGCIKLYKTDGNNGYQEPVTIDCFLLQSVQTSLKEKFSIFQSLSGDVLAYFFGKQPVIYRFSAALYNTYNQEWGHDFRNYYETYLRGSASIGKNIRTVVSYENHVIEGFFLEMNMQESATNTNLINIDFSILFIQDTVLNYNAPSFSVLDDDSETGGGMYDVLEMSSANLSMVPENFSIEKPSGDETITLTNNALLRSSPENLSDNKLKTVKAGETIIIDNNVVNGKDGSEWYAVKGGQYSDGQRINPNNKIYIKKSDARGNAAEEAMPDKKAFDSKQPEADLIKYKSDLKTGTRETDQLKKIVENANNRSQNYNSHLNASARKDNTQIYEAASSKSPVVGNMKKGDRCETLKNEGVYTKIVFGSITGYVESRQLIIGG